MRLCNCSLFGHALLYVHSKFCNHLDGEEIASCFALFVSLVFHACFVAQCHGVVCSLWLWYFLIILITLMFFTRLSVRASKRSLDCFLVKSSLIYTDLNLGMFLKFLTHIIHVVSYILTGEFHNNVPMASFPARPCRHGATCLYPCHRYQYWAYWRLQE